jgi:branched-chain amino acid transport system substrate-binding protein
MKTLIRFLLVAFPASLLGPIAPACLAAENIKVALVETLSGPPAAVGKWWANHVQWAVDQVNANGGVLGGRQIETVYFDTKSSPQEALIAFKSVTDQGLRFMFGTVGSHIALALTDAVAKHNARNPDKSVLFLNYGGLTPEMTNEKCNFWHFRFDAHADMKVEALTRQVASDPQIKKVYLINQDYAYGQAVRKLMLELLEKRRPDIHVVGDDLVPLQKTKDFAPYAAKVKASDADTVLTSNWGNDLIMLVRAGHESGLPARFYTLNAHFIGTPTAIGNAGGGRLVNVSPWHSNVTDSKLMPYYLGYKQKYKEEWNMLPMKNAVEMWAKALDTAGSTDVVKVARALEGMHYDSGTGDMWMRPDDHQLMQPQYAYLFSAVGARVKFEVENTGYGWRTEGRIETSDSTLPHTCKMERP